MFAIGGHKTIVLAKWLSIHINTQAKVKNRNAE